MATGYDSRPPARSGGYDTGRPAPARRGPIALRTAVLVAITGVALALAALPPVAGIALFSKASADHFVDLPSDLVTPPMSQNSHILAADGSTIATLRGATDRVVVPLAKITPIMQKAIIDIEDSRFYSHGGVDVKGVLRAAVHDSSSDSQQGGSTLTQQYVKNVLLQQATTKQQREAAAGDSLARKLQEARYAVALEKKLPKQEILYRYLNIAYFGDGAYGVGTASLHYFNRSVDKLNLAQAALLAGLVQSPSAYDPYTNPTAARARRAVVLDRMAQLHSITQAQADAAKKMPLGVRQQPKTTLTDSCQTSLSPFFCDYVRTQLLNDPQLGATRADRQRTLYEGGLTIRTTLDPNVQAAVQQTVNNVIEPTNRVSAAEAVIQPGTGNILAMAANRYYGTNAALGQTKVNLVTTPAFYPGSTFKAFTLATALEQGYGESTTFYSPGCLDTPEIKAAFPRGTSPENCGNGFKNDDPQAEAGVYDLSKATWDSVNTYYVQLEAKVGVPSVVNMAERLGLPAKLMREGGIPGRPPVTSVYGEFTLGAVFMDPLDMADAYATFAAHGVRCAPRYIASATDAAGRALAVATAPQCKQVLAAGVADTVTSILSGVITQGTGNPNAAAIGRPAAGKTGTNDNYASAWFVGYTPQMASAVAVGDPRGQSGYPLTNVVADGRTWSPGVYGGDLPAIIWGQSMKAALANTPVVPLPAADPTVAAGTKGGTLSTPPPAATVPPTGAAGPGSTPATPPTPGEVQLPPVVVDPQLPGQ